MIPNRHYLVKLADINKTLVFRDNELSSKTLE